MSCEECNGFVTMTAEQAKDIAERAKKAITPYVEDYLRLQQAAWEAMHEDKNAIMAEYARRWYVRLFLLKPMAETDALVIAYGRMKYVHHPKQHGEALVVAGRLLAAAGYGYPVNVSTADMARLAAYAQGAP